MNYPQIEPYEPPWTERIIISGIVLIGIITLVTAVSARQIESITISSLCAIVLIEHARLRLEFRRGQADMLDRIIERQRRIHTMN